MNNLHNLSSVESGMTGAATSLFYGATLMFSLIAIVVAIFLIIIPMCLVFVKAGRKWWEAIIPIYNLYVLTVIIGKPWCFIVGFFIPFVNFIVSVFFYYHLSKRFGHDVPFTLGLVFLPLIFLPILGYGSATYTPESIPVQGEAPPPVQA